MLFDILNTYPLIYFYYIENTDGYIELTLLELNILYKWGMYTFPTLGHTLYSNRYHTKSNRLHKRTFFRFDILLRTTSL